MPRVRPYQEQVSARGVSRPHSTPKLAGEGVGEAALRGAQHLTRAYEQRQARKAAVEDDQARLWAATATAENEVELRTHMAERVNAMDPEAPDYGWQIASLADRSEADFEESTQALLERAPNDTARQYVTLHAASSRVRLATDAIHTQADLNARFSTRIASDGVKARSRVLADNPDNDSYQDIVGSTAQTIGSLTTVAPGVKAKLIEDARHTFAQVQVTAVSTGNPTGFLQAFDQARGAAPAAVSVRDYGAPLVEPYTPELAQKLVAKVGQASPYDPLFKAAAQKYGVDWRDLKLRAVAESGLDPKASSGQATGIMQFSPATAKALGIDPGDPEQAIPAAAKMLAKYRSATGGDLAQVDRMYYGGASGANWGPNTQQYAANLSAARAVLHGSSTAPQVAPLTDQAILAAKVPLDGWGELSPAEKIAAVRNAESTVGGGMADARGALTRDLKDANATVLAGKAYPGLESPRFSEANLQRVFGADKGARAYRELQYNQRVGSAMAQMATMPAAQRAETLKALQPQPGEDFADRQPEFEAALAGAQRVATAQHKAPIEYAIEQGISEAKPLDFSSPEALMTGLRHRTQVANVMHHDYGTPVRVFTPDEVEQLAAGLGKLSGRDRVSYLVGVRKGLADDGAFNTAMNELAPKSPLLAYAANMAVRQVYVEVDGQRISSMDVATKIADGDIILNGRSLDRQMAEGKDPSMPSGADAVKFDETTFRTDFNAALGQAAFQLPDAQHGAAMQRQVYNAVRAYYVADSYQKGQPLSIIDNDRVEQAIDAVTGGVWEGVGDGGVLMAPFGMPMEVFQRQWSTRAAHAMQTAGFSEDAIDTGLDQLRPVNLADGKYGFVSGTRLVVSPDTGKAVVVDYHQPYHGSKAAPDTPDSGPLTMADIPRMGRGH